MATALELGYRHVDTAAAYFNEKEVGDGLRRAALPRDDVFVETKVFPSDYGFDETLHAFEKSPPPESWPRTPRKWSSGSGTGNRRLLESTTERVGSRKISSFAFERTAERTQRRGKALGRLAVQCRQCLYGRSSWLRRSTACGCPASRSTTAARGGETRSWASAPRCHGRCRPRSRRREADRSRPTRCASWNPAYSGPRGSDLCVRPPFFARP